MKNYLLPFAAVGLSGLISATMFAADKPVTTSSTTKEPAVTAAAAASLSAAEQKEKDAALQAQLSSKAEKPVPTTTLPPALKEDKAREKAVENHILPTELEVMATPPPAPKTETPGPAPAENYKWRPGYWAAANGEWKWMAGAWEVPPQASSVWLEGRYDEKTKKWSAPYWQADRPTPYESETPPNAKQEIEIKKF